jgi:predicted glutamine amidotransferase
MFPALVERGPDAWGWMAWNGTEVLADKHRGRSDSRGARALMANIDPNSRWLVGHTRRATHGSPRDPLNNHPIRHRNIVGVHNGMIRNYNGILRVTGRDDPRAEVDSEAVFAAVYRWGARNGLRAIDGSVVAAFTNWRHAPETLMLARSHSRPIAMAWTPAGSLVFASEEGALDSLGWNLSDYTTMLTHRLLYVREGKITKRVDYLVRREPQAYTSAERRERWERTQREVDRIETIIGQRLAVVDTQEVLTLADDADWRDRWLDPAIDDLMALERASRRYRKSSVRFKTAMRES